MTTERPTNGSDVSGRCRKRLNDRRRFGRIISRPFGSSGAILLLGAWTLLAPLTFGYGSGTVEPSGGRDVWLSLENRIWAMTWSDLVSGALLLLFGWRALTPDRPISIWICCLIGVWLSMAPVLFWAPSAAAYLNGTVVGVLLIAFTVLVPGMPNMKAYMKMGPATPPGWSYNPSSWPQRWIMIALGFAGFLASRYLAAFQLGYVDRTWDPFFDDGTRQVFPPPRWPSSAPRYGE